MYTLSDLILFCERHTSVTFNYTFIIYLKIRYLVSLLLNRLLLV